MKTIKESILNSTKAGRNGLIDSWLKNNVIIEGSYIINKNGEIDVEGNVTVKEGLKEIPDYIQFGAVTGTFYCLRNYLKDLKGCPKEAKTFICDLSYNITSLEGAPVKVENINVSRCPNLVTLSGSPKRVNRFVAHHNTSLKDLKGAPEYADEFYAYHCVDLSSLEGSPKETRWFDCSYDSKIKSLKGAPKICKGGFLCNNCDSLISLKGAPAKTKFFNCKNCKTTFYPEDVKAVCDAKEIEC